jgi:hypothetical protein
VNEHILNGRFSGNGVAEGSRGTLRLSPGLEGLEAEEKEEGRDDEGRFARGNRGGPGNPFARQVAELRKAFLERATGERLKALADKLIELALEGNVQAAKLVLSYTLGKPAAAVNPDRMDVEEWHGYRETTGMVTELPGMMRAPEPELPLRLMRGTREAATGEMERLMGGLLTASGEERKEVEEILRWFPDAGALGALKETLSRGTLRSSPGLGVRPSVNGPSANGSSANGSSARNGGLATGPKRKKGRR